MGYTHYWINIQTINSEQWRDICAFAHKTIKEENVPLLFEYDEPETEPDINEALIRFNGDDEDGHETFLLEREATDFQFCKTSRKPYDVVVGKILNHAMSVCPTFSTSNDDHLNYLTGRDYPEGHSIYQRVDEDQEEVPEPLEVPFENVEDERFNKNLTQRSWLQRSWHN
jgi:hypothetical protein